jgi:predicted nucleotidyltransferase component of viral defense system
MNKWLIIPEKERIEIIKGLTLTAGLPEESIEKDWWVTMVLKALFETTCSNYLVFKGGTSLSKGWNLIERFSEDIDVAINRDFYGITNISSKNQREKLRKLSSKYIQDELVTELYQKMRDAGIADFSIELVATETSDKDPRVLKITYPTLFPGNHYVQNWVKVEISCRSLREPFVPVAIRTIIADNYPNKAFSDEYFTVNIVSPKRTFLEKAFLLHEALQKGRIHSERMTRHLYDLHKLMDTEFAQDALSDIELYKTIVEHRSIMTRERGVDYSTHRPSQINFVPENEVVNLWEDDYIKMQQTFIYEQPIPFETIINRMKDLLIRFRSIQMDETFFDNL